MDVLDEMGIIPVIARIAMGGAGMGRKVSFLRKRIAPPRGWCSELRMIERIVKTLIFKCFFRFLCVALMPLDNNKLCKLHQLFVLNSGEWMFIVRQNSSILRIV